MLTAPGLGTGCEGITALVPHVVSGPSAGWSLAGGAGLALPAVFLPARVPKPKWLFSAEAALWPHCGTRVPGQGCGVGRAVAAPGRLTRLFSFTVRPHQQLKAHLQGAPARSRRLQIHVR